MDIATREKLIDDLINENQEATIWDYCYCLKNKMDIQDFSGQVREVEKNNRDKKFSEAKKSLYLWTNHRFSYLK